MHEEGRGAEGRGSGYTGRGSGYKGRGSGIGVASGTAGPVLAGPLFGL